VKQHNKDQFTEPEDLDEAMKKFDEFLDRLAAGSTKRPGGRTG
jgi:hypothetical protein